MNLRIPRPAPALDRLSTLLLAACPPDGPPPPIFTRDTGGRTFIRS